MLALCRVGGWWIVSYVSAQFVTAQNKHQSYAFFPPSLIMFTFVIYIFSSPHLPLFTFIMSVYHCRFSDVKLNSPVSGTDDNSDSQSRLYPVSLCFSPSLYCSLNLSPWKNKNTAMGDISVGVKSYHS